MAEVIASPPKPVMSVSSFIRGGLANSPVEAPSWKPTETLGEAVRDGTKVASAQYVSVAGS